MPSLPVSGKRRVFSSTRHTVAVDWTQAADPELIRLLEEQAALRRIATLVARGTDRLGYCGRHRRGRATVWRRRDQHDPLRRRPRERSSAAGAAEPTPAAPIGFRVSMEQDSTAARVHRTGRPARVDIDDLPGELFGVLRELGVRASVGAPVVVHGELWGAVVGATKDASFPPGAEQRLAASRNSSRKRWPTPKHAKTRRLAQAARRGRAGRAPPARAQPPRRRPAAPGGTFHHPAARRRQLERDPRRRAMRSLRTRGALRGAGGTARARPRAAFAVLTDHGLQTALGALAARAPLPVELSVDLDDRPLEALEAAAYFVVAEALTNVARYASARTATVTVRREAGRCGRRGDRRRERRREP